MKVKIDSQYGLALLNLLRQSAITGTPSVRPIAFRAGHASNVIEISDNVEEDMTTFIRNICAGRYAARAHEEIAVCDCTCAGTLMLNDFSTGGVIPLSDAEVLHSFGEIDVTVIFRYACGSYTAEDNRNCLRNFGIDAESYTVIPSRHSLIKSFRYSMKKERDYDVFDIAIETAKNRIIESLHNL